MKRQYRGRRHEKRRSMRRIEDVLAKKKKNRDGFIEFCAKSLHLRMEREFQLGFPR